MEVEDGGDNGDGDGDGRSVHEGIDKIVEL